jgi:hypothetical protein
MLGDIVIIVFALIGIFARKRWAAIVATIWLITSYIIWLTIDLYEYFYIDENIDETFEGSFLLLGILQITLIIIAWISVITKERKDRMGGPRSHDFTNRAF